MDRVTRRIGESIEFVDGKGYAKLSHEESARLLFEKLAEYEDIELTPDEIKLFLSDFGFKVIKRNQELKKELQENKEIISKMARRIKAFEENTFNMNWIPVSERLPEGTERVIVTLENEMVLEVFFISGEFKFHEGLPSGGMKKVCPDNPVVAWQPLPKPYEEELL